MRRPTPTRSAELRFLPAPRSRRPPALAACSLLAVLSTVSLAAAALPPAGAPQGTTLTPGPGFALRVATPERGIAGQVREGGVALTFRSREVRGSVASTISRPDGTVLYEYREFRGETLAFEGRDGVSVDLPRPPELRIRGILYGASTPEQVGALCSLAASRDGRLIRRIGLELVAVAPGHDLEEERRGLELATQALWSHFPPGDLPEVPLTSDYEVGSRGYVVLEQPADLVLAVNHAGESNPWEKHSDGAVNDCFGRCGAGCTGGFAGISLYPSQWTDTHGATFPAHQEVHCVTGEDWIYSWYATPTTHSVNGWWTPGCQAHDNCCRINPLLCWTVCNALVPAVALDLLADPQGEVRNWSYTDYAWSVTSYNAGYSACTCPGMSPYLDDFECVEQ